MTSYTVFSNVNFLSRHQTSISKTNQCGCCFLYQLTYGLFQKLSSKGVAGNFFGLLHLRDMRKGTNAHPQDKSEYKLPPPHLNILVPQDKLDIIMHPPSGQKKTGSPTPRIISGTALNDPWGNGMTRSNLEIR